MGRNQTRERFLSFRFKYFEMIEEMRLCIIRKYWSAKMRLNFSCALQDNLVSMSECSKIAPMHLTRERQINTSKHIFRLKMTVNKSVALKTARKFLQEFRQNFSLNYDETNEPFVNWYVSIKIIEYMLLHDANIEMLYLSRYSQRRCRTRYVHQNFR